MTGASSSQCGPMGKGGEGSSQASVNASAVLDGTYLDVLAHEHAAAFSRVLAPSAPPKTTLLWGTICSGGDVWVFIVQSLKEMYKSFGFDLHIVHRFSCEIKPNVQEWIKSVTQERGEGSADAADGNGSFCLFDRAEDMGNDCAKCARHGVCLVPRVDILMMGTSCIDVSRAISSVGGSAQTFRGAELYLHTHVVNMFLFENVDALDDTGDLSSQRTNLSIIVDRFKACGFAVKVYLMDCSLFGLPQSRRRYYILGMKESGAAISDFAAQNAQTVLDKAEQLVRLCQHAPPCASQLLLSDDDPAVDLELNRRLAMGQKTTQYNVNAAISQFSGVGLSWGAVGVQKETQDTPWLGTLASLQKNVLSFSEAEDGEAMLRDIGQSSSRVRYSHNSYGDAGLSQRIACEICACHCHIVQTEHTRIDYS